MGAMDGRIRIGVHGVVRRGHQILVYSPFIYDEKEKMFRCVGGHMEFCERSEDTLVREFKEETGLDIKKPKFLGVVENHFEHNDKMRHEIVFVYEVQFKDEAMYELDYITVTENTKQANARWIALDDFATFKYRLVPDGVLEMLRNK